YMNGTIKNYTEIDFEEVVNVTVHFYETQGNTSLVDASVNITCLTNSYIAQNTPMTNLGNGNYSWTFNAISGGQFVFKINGSQSGFETTEIQITIFVKGTTNITIYLNNSVRKDYELYFDEWLNITAFYFNKTSGMGIDTAKCNLTVLFNGTLYNMANVGAGNYSWIFDAGVWYQKVTSLPFDFVLKINASAFGFQYHETFITITIKPKPTNIDIFINNTITTNFSMYYNESIQITAFYYDTILSTGIANASVNISQVIMNEDLLNIGNYTSIYDATQLGFFELIINATKYGYEYYELTVNITVIERPTAMKIYVNGIKTRNTAVYYNESVVITAFYYDILRNTGITTAVLNLSNSNTFDLKAIIPEPGNYTLIYNTTSLTNLHFYINGSKYGYEFNSSQLTISVLPRPTKIIAYFNGTMTTNYSIYLNQTLELIITYYDILRYTGIPGAIVNLTINPTWSLQEYPVGSGNYSFIYNATTLGTFLFNVNASRYGYVFNSTILSLEVQRRPVEFAFNLNATLGNEITVMVGEQVKITLSFRDSLTGEGIKGALVNITWNPTYLGYTDADGNYTFIFNATEPGEYILHIQVMKNGYVIYSQDITIHVLAKEGGNLWMIIGVILVAAFLVVAVGFYRTRGKKEVKPKPPIEREREIAVEKELPKAVKFRIRGERDEALSAAKDEIEHEKYLDAVISYDLAAQASKKLGNMEDYEKYLEKAEDILLLRLDILQKLEEEKQGEKAEGKPEVAKEEISKVESDAVLKEKLDKLIKETKISYINIIDAAQKLGISVQKVRELADAGKYRITKSRIYKAEEVKEEPEVLDEFKDLEGFEEIIREEEEKKTEDQKEDLKMKLNKLIKESRISYMSIADIAQKLGISIKETRNLATQEGYRVTQKRIYKKKQ
ncbi:MAG: hypothetical protein ACTSYB_17035, partial [Candidatus Helarchaeota archaeon]